MAKIQPAPKTLAFYIEEAGVNYIDISQCASIASRRFLRQGLNWAVGGFTFVSSNPGQIVIEKLPDTWVCSNAWHKAYAHWKAQQDDAVREAGGESAVAKFRDFKIHADSGHVDAGFTGNLIPGTYSLGPFSTGEWQASQIVLPNIVPDASGSLVDPQEYFLHMVGTNNHGGLSRGIIDGYANSRAYPQSPDPVSPVLSGSSNWLRQMDDVGNMNPEVIANATDRNDDLPYDQDDYPGGDTNGAELEFYNVTHFSGTTISQKNFISGTSFPCGLIKLDSNIDGAVTLLLHLVPGNSRGYMTQPMQDM